MRSAGIGLGVYLLIGLAGCGGGGGGGGSFAGGAPPAAQPGSQNPGATPPGSSAGQFVNPAWNVPAASPSKLWTDTVAPPTTFADWFQQRPWLLDRSLWASYSENGRQPGRADLGAYGVGNGRCFGIVGLGYPLNTLHNMVGPSYMNAGGFFADTSTGLAIGSRQVAFLEEWVYKVRRQAVVLTKASEARAELYTIDHAPPGVDAIVRTVVVKNRTAADLRDVVVLTRVLGGAAEGARLVQRRADRKLAVGGRGARLLVPTVAGDTLRVPLGDIPPGAEVEALVYLVFTRNGNGEAAVIRTIETEGSDRLLERTRTHWDRFFAEGARLETPDPKFSDWVDDMLVTGAIQINEHGAVSPLSRYTKAFIRDTEGPIRLFLKTGRHEAARRAIRYLYAAARHNRAIENSTSLDLDPAAAPPPPADWSTISFMPGRNPVEAPSYLPLYAHDYYRATGDVASVREWFEWARAAVELQEVSADGLMRFNGDEPFRWVLMLALGAYEPENRGWSSNSAFLYVAAAERVAEMARVLGRAQDEQEMRRLAAKVRAGTERCFWLPNVGHWDVIRLFLANAQLLRPFEDINLLPLHVGYVTGRDPKGRENLLAVMRLLGRPGGTVQSRFLPGPYLEGYDGHVPGYYLENLALVDHADAETAFNALERVAQVSGEVAEGQFQSGHSVILLKYSPTGLDDGDVTARYRPWEGSICVDGALVYLLGLEPDAERGRVSLVPHLPNGWGTLALRDARLAGEPYDVLVRELGGRRLYRVTNRGARPLTVDLTVSLARVNGVTGVRVDGVDEPLAGFAFEAEFDRVRFRLGDRLLAPGAWVDVDVTYAPR